MVKYIDKLKKTWKTNRHQVLMWFWIAMIIPTILWWKDSILWVAIMSLYANIEASASAKEAMDGNKND